jgi:hypothetical protein
VTYTTEFQSILPTLQNHYIHNYNRQECKLQKPIVIFSSSASILRALQLQMQKWARLHHGEVAVSRIKGLWAANQCSDWNSKFISNPSDPSAQVDVVMMTHCVNAGFSIEDHYKTRFSLFPLSFIEYRKEHQLQERLRWREDLDQNSYVFLQTGETYRNQQGDFKKLAARNEEINNYFWPQWQEKTFAECTAELEQTHCFHIQNWKKAADERKFEMKLLDGNEEKELASSLLDEHLVCGSDLQSGLYKSLFRRYTSSVEQQMQHDATVEISRVYHWDYIKSYETLFAIVTGDDDDNYGSKGEFSILILELNSKFILALCNVSEVGPKALETDIQKLIRPAKKLCILLDYLLSSCNSEEGLDCLDYWGNHLTKAKKSGTTARIKLIPIIWSFLSENIPGLDLESILTMDEEDWEIAVELDLMELIQAYEAMDPGSKLWSTAYPGDKWVMKGKRNKNRLNITTGTFVKALLSHIGVKARVSQNNPSKRKRGEASNGGKKEWNITIISSIQNLCIITCIFSHMHWGNFHKISAGIEKSMTGHPNTILLYKEDVIETHLEPKGSDGDANAQDLDSTTVINSSQTNMIMTNDEDMQNYSYYIDFMNE